LEGQQSLRLRSSHNGQGTSSTLPNSIWPASVCSTVLRLRSAIRAPTANGSRATVRKRGKAEGKVRLQFLIHMISQHTKPFRKAPAPPPMAFFPPMMPAYMMPPHPFAMRHPFGPPPPPPMTGRFPPYSSFPPHILPPRFPFMPPFMGPPPNERTEGPIITEQVYDTFPRRGMNYEEPIYMPSNNSGVLPPHSSYKPDTMPSEHYESYYDNRAYHNRRGRKVRL